MGTMKSDTLSVQRRIEATPERIFALLADAGQHASFDGSGTVRGTSAPSQPLHLGSRFGMSMRMGLPYRTVNEVVEYVPERRIAWQTSGLGGLLGGRIWRYELEPTDDGATLVRETWDLSQDRQAALLKRSRLPAATQRNMRATLDRLARTLAEDTTD